MRDAQEELAATGGGVVLVGLGKPEDAAQLKRELRLPFRILVDPGRETYRAAGAIEGSSAEVLSPAAALGAPWAMLRGGVRVPRQNWRQLGGTLVIAPGGEVAYRQLSRRPGDDASPERVVAELSQAAARAGTRA